MVKLTKLKKTEKKKSNLFGQVIKNCSQRFPSLARRVAPFSLYQNIVPTECLRNQLGMAPSFTIGRYNWCSLTSASPSLTEIIVVVHQWANGLVVTDQSERAVYYGYVIVEFSRRLR